MKTIGLTKLKMALISDEDFEWLIQWKWQYSEARCGEYGYACRKEFTIDGRKTIYMHKEVGNRIGIPIWKECDHIDRNYLNNQRHNLRPATDQETSCNRNRFKNNRTGYIGVEFNRGINNPYRASIRVNGQLIFLGVFKDAVTASKIRDEAAIKYFGEYAKLNFESPHV